MVQNRQQISATATQRLFLFVLPGLPGMKRLCCIEAGKPVATA
jgi:hypothetical protein